MEVGGLTDKDHEVLGVEYCSGYTDSFGKWNTGFHCPPMGERVYCCGTSSHKYCCTKRDEESGVGLDQTILLLVVLGSILVAILIVLVTCLLCKRCVGQRKRHANGGPLYRLHCSSTASGVANMYSFSGQNSSATTPIEGLEPHHMVDLPLSDQQLRASHLGRQRPYRADPPPPYHSCDPTIPTTTSFSSSPERMAPIVIATYRSTKL